MKLRIFFQRNPRLIWLAGHLALNILYTIIILNLGKLFGEASAIAISSDTPIIFISILLFFSFIYFNIFLFNITFKFSLIPIKFKANEAGKNRIGLVLLVLQLLYFAYFLMSGVGVAGSTEKHQSILSQIWVLIPVDVLFLLYYSTYRGSKYFLLNLIVNIVSNLIRGWSGFLLTIIFIESCILIRQGRASWPKLFYFSLVIISLYPVLYYGKIFSRYYGLSSDASFDDFLNTLSSFDLINLLQEAIIQVGDRIQLISSAISTYEISNQLGDLIAIEIVAPFWNEGIHTLAWDRLFSETQRLDVGKAIANILDPYSLNINWNSNPTFIGWFFIIPILSFLNIIYASLLVCITSMLIKPISTAEVTKDFLWYMILVLIIPGWYGAYVLFVYGCFLYFLLHILFISKIKVVKSCQNRPT
ncbi:oligosaccharide repeat unit polymerase [Limnohabitans planktonicus]|uniref:oligosaccharide repeat unit polymerase n=1 Tax=Limnohabitans planktonicus TaxID=540060 RepID=UPI000A68C743|nr:oligosaccharide repeat unit polymerase [Limnohabitans planktonicus]